MDKGNGTLLTIFENHPDAKRDSLIPILQEVQEAQGYLSREAVREIGTFLRLPSSKIYGVATFYNQFRFQSLGKYNVQVCRGTACHVIGSLAVLEAVKRELKIQPGQTTRDGRFSIEVVACLGACGLAPVISINGEFYANVKPAEVKRILNGYRKEALLNETK